MHSGAFFSRHPSPEIMGAEMDDRSYMKLALRLAERGAGHTSPNPLVGAVIVRDGKILGEGWHRKYGDLHAEREALASASGSVEGATMYVTLEPCCHYGHQPPCTDAIIDSGIKRVVVASQDPNPLVAGKGIAILRSHGIEVTEGVMRKEADYLNEIFFHYITTRRPFVAVKYAMTLDGKIACYTGASKWITGEDARRHVHVLRNRYSAILTGSGTVAADDPLLTCRIPHGRNPVRIVVDTSLSTPIDSRIIRTAGEVRTVIASCSSDSSRIRRYIEAGCDVWTLPSSEGHVSIPSLIERLGGEGIDSVLCECGGELSWSLLNAGVVNKVYAYISPKILGGSSAPTPVGGRGIPDPSSAVILSGRRIRQFGDDLLIEGGISVCSQG